MEVLKGCQKHTGSRCTTHQVDQVERPHGDLAQPAVNRLEVQTTAPVNTLCPDILSIIFLLVAQSADCVFPRYARQVSHICRYWRAVALDTPWLWNRLAFKAPKLCYAPSLALVSELQSRAQSVPLYVQLLVDMRDRGCALGAGPAIHAGFPDFLRIRSLDVSCDFHVLSSIFQPYVDIPNPLIRHLSISIPDYGYAEPMEISFKLFGDHMPNLKSLDIRTCNYDWRSVASFHSLESLRLFTYGAGSLTILAQLPRLKSLHVEYPRGHLPFGWQDLVPDAPSTSKIAVFKSLQSLIIDGGIIPSQVVSMLSYVSLPACTHFSLDVTCASHFDDDQPYFDLLSCLSQLVAERTPLPRIPIHSLALTPSEIVAKAWEDWDVVPIDGREDHKCPPIHYRRGRTFVFRMYTTGWTPTPIRNGVIIRSLVDLLDLQRLHSLAWKRSSHAFDAHLNLDCGFFDSLAELRVIEVQEVNWKGYTGILPIIESRVEICHDEYDEDVQRTDVLMTLRPTMRRTFKYCTSCPNLSEVTIILPLERLEVKEEVYLDYLVSGRIAMELQQRNVAGVKRLTMLKVCEGYGCKGWVLPKFIASKLQN
ncbi:hypothetical protein AX16_002460 [Volvariella volvacea WC 439]|nr:hypothetical protein AX16_002460 [Volvariella volvacea WC 439]